MNKEQLLLIVNCIISFVNAGSPKEYGYLSVYIESIDLCKGPKRRDCCIPVITTDGSRITYDLLVKENFVLSIGKVAATAQGKEVMRFQMKKPCDHFLIRSLFKLYLNVTDNCGVTKGHYVFTTNVQELSEKYYGGKYFYGNWTFRSIFAGHDCNFFCTMMNVVMVPKKNK